MLKKWAWEIIQGFLDITSTSHLSLTCKYLFELRLLERDIRIKLSRLLTDCGLDLSIFWDLLRQVQGTITGSIFLELILGANEFKANDVDIFIRHNSWPDKSAENPYFRYSPLHQYLFEVSTGLVSDPKVSHFPKCHENVNAEFVNRMNHLPGSMTVQWDYFCTMMPTTDYNPHIHTIDTYTMPNGRNLQVVAWSFDAFVSWPDYTQRHFDFGVCASTCDGINCNIRDVYDVAEKRLRYQPEFWEAYQKTPLTRNNAREKRYLDRGFHFNKRIKT